MRTGLPAALGIAAWAREQRRQEATNGSRRSRPIPTLFALLPPPAKHPPRGHAHCTISCLEKKINPRIFLPSISSHHGHSSGHCGNSWPCPFPCVIPAVQYAAYYYSAVAVPTDVTRRIHVPPLCVTVTPSMSGHAHGPGWAGPNEFNRDLGEQPLALARSPPAAGPGTVALTKPKGTTGPRNRRRGRLRPGRVDVLMHLCMRRGGEPAIERWWPAQ
ncbi:hypothetical protein SORBI_3003G395150 [Sorghum bicolor]|uniref:Uncharacterized protein n=1 Tax=Sorghum bicolor TaxID=4558 RepID=A0A1W0W154_SORBI|nr:hypothetical protein SORBI_3003G395150 [Sorghum bicolor]